MGYVTRKDLEAAGVVIPEGGSAPWSPPWLVPPTVPTGSVYREAVARADRELELSLLGRSATPLPKPDEEPRYLGTKEEVAAREGKAATPAPVAPWEMPRPGSRPWLTTKIAFECAITPDAVTLHDPEPGTIEVEVRECSPAKVAEAIAAIRHVLPLGLDIRARGIAKPDPYPNAALHKAIDAAIAADSGPFAHARAAALRAWGEGRERRSNDVAGKMRFLVGYEKLDRGGMRAPGPLAAETFRWMMGAAAFEVYERERSRSPVHGRRAR